MSLEEIGLLRSKMSYANLLDCLWCELYGSINGAEIDDQAITHEHAQYLRTEILGIQYD